MEKDGPSLMKATGVKLDKVGGMFAEQKQHLIEGSMPPKYQGWKGIEEIK